MDRGGRQADLAGGVANATTARRAVIPAPGHCRCGVRVESIVRHSIIPINRTLCAGPIGQAVVVFFLQQLVRLLVPSTTEASPTGQKTLKTCRDPDDPDCRGTRRTDQPRSPNPKRHGTNTAIAARADPAATTMPRHRKHQTRPSTARARRGRRPRLPYQRALGRRVGDHGYRPVTAPTGRSASRGLGPAASGARSKARPGRSRRAGRAPPIAVAATPQFGAQELDSASPPTRSTSRAVRSAPRPATATRHAASGHATRDLTNPVRELLSLEHAS